MAVLTRRTCRNLLKIFTELRIQKYLLFRVTAETIPLNDQSTALFSYDVTQKEQLRLFSFYRKLDWLNSPKNK